MKVQDRNKIIALIATLLVAIVVVMIMLYSNLYFEWPPKDQPAPKESEILFGGEYVMLGDVQEPATEELASPEPQPKEDVATADKPEEPENLISSKVESPMKVTEQKENNDSKKDNKKKQDKKATENDKLNKEKSKEISNNVAKGFGSGKGKQGVTNGNSDTGSRSGTPGYSLKGRTLEAWGKPSSRVEGTVVIQVRVNPKGKVIEASYRSGSGSANANMSVRESCRQASLHSQFSVANDRTTNQVGTITWRFE